MAKYAMIGKAEPIPQNSRSTVCDAFDCLKDDLVTSRAAPIQNTRFSHHAAQIRSVAGISENNRFNLIRREPSAHGHCEEVDLLFGAGTN